MSEQPLLGSILCARGLLRVEQLREALQRQVRSGLPLGRILVDLQYVSEDDVCSALGVQHGLPTIQLKKMVIPEDVIASVSIDVVKNYQMIPVSLEGPILTIAVTDVMRVAEADDLKFVVGKDLKMMLTSVADMEFALARYYQVYPEDDRRETIAVTSDMDDMSEWLERHEEEAPVIELVNMILSRAIKELSSDIHWESCVDGLHVRCRMDGVLVDMMCLPVDLSAAVISRIKVMADMDITETRLPQDGRIDYRIGEKWVDLRVSTLPTIHGESVVIRVLDKGQITLSMSDLGIEREEESQIKQSLHKSSGLMLVTGPTGSGKTTSVYAMLKEINHVDRKIITVEDPVEYEIDGIIQVPVRSNIGLDFSKCLRHILRQDPDTLMIGEIRDQETMDMAVQSALTGHLVLSTLHTNDAVGCLARMLDMGIEPFLITSTVNVIVAQRLVRTICSYCREEMTPSVQLLQEIGLDKSDVALRKFYCGHGCERCQFSGYRGRTGIFEILKMTSLIQSLILKDTPATQILEAAQTEGMQSLREYGLNKVYEGVTTLEEVLQETQTSI